MTELKNLERELSRFRFRLIAAAAFVLFAFGLLMARLVHLQVVKHDQLQLQAENNRISVVPIVPNRGLIVDRNGVVLANNYSAYTIEITPSKLDRPIDEVIDALAQIVSVEPRDRRRFRKLLEESKSFESLPIRTKLSEEEVARFTAQRFRFPGVEIKARLFRHYPFGEVASHVLGYIGRINTKEQEALDEEPDEVVANYRGTDYIGKLGIEQSYERELHGVTGFEEVETSAGGRAVRRLKASPPTPGNTVRLSIDIKLQQLVEQLYGDRRGALVAMDPRTGEILAFVSKPTFDPNLFVDGIDSDSWKELNESIDKPLLNRALNGTYPPGSTYKPFMALIGLQTGKRTPGQAISDPGYFWFGNHKFRDDKEGGHGLVDMYRSIVQSCDTYYYMLANDLGVDTMAEQMAPFGFGQITGIDIRGESKGLLPSTEWKRKFFRKPEQQKWYAGETISLGIGQGYNSFTILQMAQATSTMSSGGVRFKPHLVKEVVNVVSNDARKVAATPLPSVPLKPENVEVIKRAMVGVNIEGTSAAAFRGAAYVAAGKTGTAQVVGIKANEKYNAAKMAEHLRDHALYSAFAPAEQPKIAVALVVENAGFGAQSAAPIVRRVFDYWLQGVYPTPEDIAAVQEGKATAPLKPPVPVAQAASALLAASAPEVASSRPLPPIGGVVAPLPTASGASR
ncbi:penicillin-binding protein 2 [Ideonella sp. BN130291]|uniref:penicillin-binding protein 2 n=1 Tax=Ideonella sp. BN130291 TaxID=3112940 RepID=UPI002E271AC5|nr:penicillin-binding protein 2 [Ideonella sp. BN130291]